MKRCNVFFIGSFLFIISFSDCNGKKNPISYEQYDSSSDSQYENPLHVRYRSKRPPILRLEKGTTKINAGTTTSTGDSSTAGTTTVAPAAPGGKPGTPVGKIKRPSVMGDRWNNRFKSKWHPSWMQYCDPINCNDYHKPACGLNRKTMRFRWFQSGCHITLNNFCSTYRGSLKYDTIAANACVKNVMHLRAGCPAECPDISDPVCGNSLIDNHVVLFKNTCWMDLANCKSKTLNEYEPVDISICKYSMAFREISSKI